MDLDQFKAHLDEMDRRDGNKVSMFNCRAMDHGNGLFGFDYDALTGMLVKFTTDGKIQEWVESCNPADAEHFVPHFEHDSIEAWMNNNVQRMAMPEEA